MVAVQGREVSLLRALASITNPFFRTVFLIWLFMWLSVGTEAWEPSWWSFEESAPVFLAMLPFILLWLVASSVRWCLAWRTIILTVSLHGMYGARRFFRPVNAGVISNRITPTLLCSASHLILPTASFPIQETLVNAVGLTSVARRLQ